MNFFGNTFPKIPISLISHIPIISHVVIYNISLSLYAIYIRVRKFFSIFSKITSLIRKFNFFKIINFMIFKNYLSKKEIQFFQLITFIIFKNYLSNKEIQFFINPDQSRFHPLYFNFIHNSFNLFSIHLILIYSYSIIIHFHHITFTYGYLPIRRFQWL